MKKRQTLKIAVVLLLLAGTLASCEEKEKYPTEISFTEYSLTGTSCQWTNLNYDDRDGNVKVINSNKELENFIACSDGEFPKIDFSTYTLLLVSGTTYQNIETMNLSLEQHSANKYQLNVEIRLGEGDMMDTWTLALLVKKIGRNSRVSANVEIIQN